MDKPNAIDATDRRLSDMAARTPTFICNGNPVPYSLKTTTKVHSATKAIEAFAATRPATDAPRETVRFPNEQPSHPICSDKRLLFR